MCYIIGCKQFDKEVILGMLIDIMEINREFAKGLYYTTESRFRWVTLTENQK